MRARKVSIHDELEQWGAWSKRGVDAGIGYPTMTGFRRLAGAPLNWEHDINYVPLVLTISDDRALEIDKAITTLPLDLRTVLYLKYYEDYQNIKIAKAMRINRDKVANLLETAKRILDYISYPQTHKK